MSSGSGSASVQRRRDGAAPPTATYVLLPGAGGDSWYWHLVAPELRARGHEVLTPDLPADDDSAGLGEYTEAVVTVLGDRSGLIVVAQSMAAFVAPMLCELVDGLRVHSLAVARNPAIAPTKPRKRAWLGRKTR